MLNRNVGDCEIKSISFMDESVSFRLFDPANTHYFTITFHSIGHLIFETSHVQNVIDSIEIFDSTEQVVQQLDRIQFLRRIDAEILRSASTRAMKFAYIQPITGGETFLSFKSFEIEG